ncbi:MAG: alanine dehydrogenase [Chloroflexi bacterium]|nr:alanine dehydrogenase [Chloroflexota bacterium]
MEFGVPKEIRDLEMRVGLTPPGVLALTQAGHTVYVERDAGHGAGFTDEHYRQAGAQIVYSTAEAYGRADVVAKIARPTAAEHRLFRSGQIICSFLHLRVASPDLLNALTEHEITAISYEELEEDDGVRPVLLPASEVAGRMAPIIAGNLLRSGQSLPGQQGLGMLLSGLPGVPAAAVVIVGAGVVGSNAAHAFCGVGAAVTVVGRDIPRLRQIEERSNGRVTTMLANEFNLKRAVQFADVLVGAILEPGKRAPVLISREMVRSMRPGSIIIDFSIDEGGCVETSRPTTLRDPIYMAEGVIHHCVPNITSAVARTTSYAITNAALPHLLSIADNGLLGAVQKRASLLRGVVLYHGKLTHPDIASTLDREVQVHLSPGGSAFKEVLR